MTIPSVFSDPTGYDAGVVGDGTALTWTEQGAT